MKNRLILFFLASIFTLTNCNPPNVKVLLTSAISVALPANYQKVQQAAADTITQYKVRVNNNDHIIVTSSEIKGLDTLRSDGRETFMDYNLRGYMRAFKGSNLVTTRQDTSNLSQTDFRFDFDKEGVPYTLFGRVLLDRTHFLIFSYQAPQPVSNSSIDNKNQFLNSIQCKN